MARKHESRMSGKGNTIVNKAYIENTGKNREYQAAEKKSRLLSMFDKFFARDRSVRKKE